MTPILTNCRDRMTAEDFRVIVSALSRDPERRASLAELLTDPAARDAALESDEVFHALLDSPESLLATSPQLYFYVLTRRLLTAFDREIADYVAGLLSAFLDIRRLRSLSGLPEHTAEYITGMLTALKAASSQADFSVRVQIANHALFMTGIFPDHLRHRTAMRGAPDISFYEQVGSANYRLASDQSPARRHALVEVYRTMGERFSEVRRNLNRLSSEFLCLNPLGTTAR
jgi:hypothetical protein